MLCDEAGCEVKAMPERDAIRGYVALGVLLMVGLICGGWVLGAQIKAMKLSDRYVTVKGLVERTVKSDTATWAVSFKEAGNDLPAVFAKSEADKQAVRAFFAAQGFKPEEISEGQIQVTDKQANEYGNPGQQGSRFIVQQTVTLRSGDVDKVAQAGAKTADLVKAGVVVANTNGQGGIVYRFMGLNALKPDMITEATRNARASADRFAADSSSQVGSIRSANQGVFSITAAGAGSGSFGEDPNGGGGEQVADASIMKKVRVVSTVDYYLLK